MINSCFRDDILRNLTCPLLETLVSRGRARGRTAGSLLLRLFGMFGDVSGPHRLPIIHRR